MAVDTELSVELAVLRNVVSDINNTVIDVQGEVDRLEAGLSGLEETVNQIDARLSELEIGGTNFLGQYVNSHKM